MSFLSSLRDQLFVMASVEHDLEEELVPGLVGSGIEKKGTLNGVCYFLFSNEQALKVKLLDNLNQIRDLFFQARDRLQAACTIHFESLQKEIANEPFDFVQKTKSEGRILHVCTYLNPFIKQFLKELDLPYLRFLREGLDLNCWLSYLTYAKLVQKAKNLELTTGLPVPFKVLSTLLSGDKLNAKESDVIDAWLTALEDSKSVKVATFKGNKKNPYVCVHSLHHFLKDLAFTLAWDCAELEMKLADRGCRIFFEPDPQWIKIRKKLKQGDSLFIQGQEYIIDECTRNAGNNPEEHMMFSLQNDPWHFIMIHNNEAFGDIQLKLDEKYHFGIVRCERKAKQGAISVFENTTHHLSSIIWESGEGFLSDNDVIQAHPIVELLAGLSLQPCTPYPLSPHHFAFNKDNEMRSLDLTRMGPMSFETLENFAWECSLNQDGSVNSSVFTYLMQAGKLVNLPLAKSYQELLVKALDGEEIDEAVSFNGLFTKSTILDYRKDFFLSVQEIKKQITKEIKSLYQVVDVKKLHEELVSAFQFVHLRDCPGRILLPNFSDQCKHHVLLNLKLRMRAILLAPIREALINKIAGSDLGNCEIQAEWAAENKYYLYGIYNKNQQDEIYYQGENKYKLNKIS